MTRPLQVYKILARLSISQFFFGLASVTMWGFVRVTVLLLLFAFATSQENSDAGCSRTFTDDQVSLESPGYPSGYPPDLDCTYSFQGPACPTYFNLQFLDFNLMQSQACLSDRVEIANRDVLCISTAGNRTYYSENGMIGIRFVSDAEASGRGFKILVTRLPCGVVLETTTADPNVPWEMNPFNVTSTSTVLPSTKAEETTTAVPIVTRKMNPIPLTTKSTLLPVTKTTTAVPSFTREINPVPLIPNSNPPITKPEVTTAVPSVPWEMNPFTLSSISERLPATTPKSDSAKFCCPNFYNSKHFFLSSPGFPHSNKMADECIYHIHRANANVCRLRIHFRFFWSGEQDPIQGCSNGFLRLDGKDICGCRTGLKLTSTFDSRLGDVPKILTFKNSGLSRGRYNGFVLEVIQDECPKRLSPVDEAKSRSLPGFPTYFYNDQYNRAPWPVSNYASLERALLVAENIEILDVDYHSPYDREVKSIYFFEAPNYEDDDDYGFDISNLDKGPKEIEESSYVDTSSLTNSFLPDDDSKCEAWCEWDWTMLSKETLWQQMPQCSSGGTPTSRQCEQFDYVQGYIQSPGYPNYYPDNSRVCYRLNRQRGYCKIKMNFVDFDLEDSFECRKDFLLLGGEYRYCGQNLHRSVFTLDLRNTPFEEIVFISDRFSRGRGRGFKATYEQIRCDNGPVNPPNPVYPPPSTGPYPPPLPPRPTNPQTFCNKDIQDDFFVVEIYGQDPARCPINVIRNGPRICRVQVILHQGALDCRNEYLLINNRKYCNNKNNQLIDLNFNNYQLPIIYERTTRNPAQTGLRVRFSVSQLSEGCDLYDYPRVPAERFLSSNNTNKQVQENSDTAEINRAFYARKYENYACGLILNASEDTIASSLCNFLAERDSSTKCVQITAKEIYVPYNTDEAKLQDVVLNEIGEMRSFYGVEEVGLKEISCDDISLLFKK